MTTAPQINPLPLTVLVVGGDLHCDERLEHAFSAAVPNVRLFRVPSIVAGQEHLAGLGMYSDRGAYPMPQLILMDLDSTRRGGFELLQWRRQRPNVRRIPVMVLTSFDQSHDVDQAYALGANSCLLKCADDESTRDLARGIGAYATLLGSQGRDC